MEIDSIGTKQTLSDSALCIELIALFATVFPNLSIEGGADDPFYSAPRPNAKAKILFSNNYPRSLLHEVSHYCLAGKARRRLDDYGYWYHACGRTAAQQALFEQFEARPQGLEKAMCAIIGLDFSPSLDDFSGRPISKVFLQRLESHYQQMQTDPPPMARQALEALKLYRNSTSAL